MRRTEKEWWLRRMGETCLIWGVGTGTARRSGARGATPPLEASRRQRLVFTLLSNISVHRSATKPQHTATHSTQPLFAGLRAHVYLAAGYGTCEQIAAATVAYPRRAPPRLPRINTISLSSPHSTLVVLSGSLSPRARSWRAALPERRRTPSHRSAENVVVSRGTAARD